MSKIKFGTALVAGYLLGQVLLFGGAYGIEKIEERTRGKGYAFWHAKDILGNNGGFIRYLIPGLTIELEHYIKANEEGIYDELCRQTACNS